LDFKTDRKGVYAGFKKIVPPATLK
jgi:hypothetical protein